MARTPPRDTLHSTVRYDWRRRKREKRGRERKGGRERREGREGGKGREEEVIEGWMEGRRKENKKSSDSSQLCRSLSMTCLDIQLNCGQQHR